MYLISMVLHGIYGQLYVLPRCLSMFSTVLAFIFSFSVSLVFIFMLSMNLVFIFSFLS